MRDTAFGNNVELFPQSPIISVTLIDGTYNVKTVEGQIFKSQTQPLLASGFQGSHNFVSHLFDKRKMVFLYLVSVMNLLLLRECSFVARQFGMMIMIFASYTNIVSALL